MYNVQLETYVQVVETGSFRKAAEIMFISTTAVIKQINLLEDRLGVKLLERTHRGIILTDAGRVFYEDAKYMISYSAHAIARAKNAAAGHQIVRIATSVLTDKTLLNRILAVAREMLPELRCQMVPFENTPGVANSLMNHIGEQVDIIIAMCEMRESRTYAVQPVSYEPLVIAVPNNHPLAEKRFLRAEDLHGYEMILFSRGFNSDIDILRDDLEQNHPQIRLLDVPFMDLHVFNRADWENVAMIAVEPWKNVHPGLKYIPVDWNYTVPFGMLFAHTPSEETRKFIDAVAVYFQDVIEKKKRI